MNTRIFVSILLSLIPSYGTKAQELKQQSLPFACPVECQSVVYQPICSRGKSYASLCILKQQICKGDTAPEIYKDVESCPKYEKDEDAAGSSVEMIDKNGVIFRIFDDFTENNKFTKNPMTTDILEEKSMHDGESMKIDEITNAIDENHLKTTRIQTCSKSLCTDQEITDHPVCIVGIEISNFCAVKRLVCQSYLPTLAIFLAKPCESTVEAISSIPSHSEHRQRHLDT